MSFVIPLEPDHKIFNLPSATEAKKIINEKGVDAWNSFMIARNKRIRLESSNPLEYGVELPMWYLADWVLGRVSWEEFCLGEKCPKNMKIPLEWQTEELRRAFEGEPAQLLLILGGTGSTKTEYMLKRLLEDMIAYDKHISWVFHETSEASVSFHHSAIYKYMPKVWEKAGKSKVTYASYKVKTGFSDMSLVAPNSSKMTFRSYEQDIKSIESGKLGAASSKPSIGYITDELCPLSYLETLRGRIASRNACGIHGFTPLQGYSPMVKFFRDGAEVVLSRLENDISKPRNVPLVEVKVYRDGKSPAMKMAVVYFHSRYSPYANYKALQTLYSLDSDSVKLIRYDGYCESEKQELFPKLSRKIHGFNDEDLPEKGSNYLFVDPCGIHRNWFMLWIRVDVFGRIWVYREWPCPNIHIPNFGCPGPWAEEGQDAKHKVGGIPAIGSKSLGFGLLDFKNEIARLEGWDDLDMDIAIKDCNEFNGSKENVRDRKIDSRFANVGSYSAEGNTTLIDECSKVNLYFGSTSGKKISEGIELINNALAYTKDGDEIIEAPRLYISNSCENLWFALENYTGLGGEKEATKDPIDVLRYALMDDPVFIEYDSQQFQENSRWDKDRFYFNKREYKEL